MRNLQDELISLSERIHALAVWVSENHDLDVKVDQFSPRQYETLKKLMARPGCAVYLYRPDVDLLREHWGQPRIVETKRDFYKIDMDDLVAFVRRVQNS